MELFSLRSVIDDILLLVRNNNISESEDLSRAQIASWILAYKAAIIKARQDADKNKGEEDDTDLTELLETKGPFKLEDVDSLDDIPSFSKRTEGPIPEIVDNDPCNIFSVHDQQGYPIQMMTEERKFFHRFRKYTGGEITYHYENGYIYLHGLNDLNKLRYIWVEGLWSESDEELDEDAMQIPGWMIPDIKNNIMKNELSFMLGRISDDDNNSTLDGIKPQPQQEIAYEK